MTKEERINFIKWLYKKAGEPFQLCEYPNITSVYIPSKEHAFNIEDFEYCCPDYIWSLLLQKAIEGVNKKTNIKVEAYPYFFRVYKDGEYGMSFSHDTIPVNQAKESALIWVKENE